MIYTDIRLFVLSLQKEQPLLGLDMGAKRTGVALSDPDRVIASPHSTYTHGTKRQDLGHFSSLCQQFSVGGLVMGLPLFLDGNENESCQRIRLFAERFINKTSLPILLVDERFSTALVTRSMKDHQVRRKKRHKKDDILAATHLLQQVLDQLSPVV